MRRLLSLFLLFLLVGFCAFSSSQETPLFQKKEDVFKKMDSFAEAVILIQKNYVDIVSFEKILEGSLKGLMNSLDPFCQYLDKQSADDLENINKGDFGGLGLELTLKNGYVHVIAPLEDSPAEKAGILAGDSIIRIDNFPTKDASLSEAVKKLKGPIGSKVHLQVMREGDSQIHEFDVERSNIRIETVKEAKMLAAGIAYVRLSAFQERSAEDFKQALTKLKESGPQILILDLRNNAGGLLSSAVEVAEQIIAEKQLIVYTHGRNDKEVQFFSSNPNSFTYKRLIVLINKGSASGSEILAGAVQDHSLGVVMGERSFGKASVQKIIRLKDGSGLRMTTSHYFTPQGREIHAVGITPDVEVKDEKDAASKKDNILQTAVEYAETL